MSYFMTFQQARAAHRLAKGFGHEWGVSLSEDDLAEMASDPSSNKIQ